MPVQRMVLAGASILCIILITPSPSITIHRLRQMNYPALSGICASAPCPTFTEPGLGVGAESICAYLVIRRGCAIDGTTPIPLDPRDLDEEAPSCWALPLWSSSTRPMRRSQVSFTACCSQSCPMVILRKRLICVPI
jgi:hypothetical protein